RKPTWPLRADGIRQLGGSAAEIHRFRSADETSRPVWPKWVFFPQVPVAFGSRQPKRATPVIQPPFNSPPHSPRGDSPEINRTDVVSDVRHHHHPFVAHDGERFVLWAKQTAGHPRNYMVIVFDAANGEIGSHRVDRYSLIRMQAGRKRGYFPGW